MGDLPVMPRGSGIQRTVQLQFGGLDRSPGAADGTLWDTKNLTTDELPLIAARSPRKFLETGGQRLVGMLLMDGKLLTVNTAGTVKYGNLVLHQTAANAQRRDLVQFGRSVVMMPDKLLLRTEYNVLGAYATLAELKAAVTEPAEEDAYLVGGVSQREVYAWVGGEWTDCGKMAEPMEATAENQSVVFKSGTYQDVPAKDNTIAGLQKAFTSLIKVGDSVTISGADVEANNKTVIVREVKDTALVFYENTFSMGSYPASPGPLSAKQLDAVSAIVYAVDVGEEEIRLFTLTQDLTAQDTLVRDNTNKYILSIYRNGVKQSTIQTVSWTGERPVYNVLLEFNDTYTASQYSDTITIKKSMPDLQNCFADENRLWGTVGSEIYASKLGDPANFYCFEGLSTDSYFLEIQTPGDFTAGCSAYGYPTFFKTDYIYRIYGAKPDTYQLQELSANGVKAGCEKSIAMVDNTLMYLSTIGVMAYTGGYPEKCDQALGNVVLSEAEAGTDGQKYYLCAKENGGDRVLYVFDAIRGAWIREMEWDYRFFSASGGCLVAAGRFASSPDKVYVLAGTLPGATMQEGLLQASAEFGDIMMQTMNRKSVHRVQLRLVIEAYTTVTVAIRYDSTGDWITVKELEAQMKQSVYLPILPRRCDHFRLKITGNGMWKIFGLGLDLRQGSEQF